MNEKFVVNRWHMLPCVSHCPSHFKMFAMWGTKAESSTCSVCKEGERQEDSAYKDSYL